MMILGIEKLWRKSANDVGGLKLMGSDVGSNKYLFISKMNNLAIKAFVVFLVSLFMSQYCFVTRVMAETAPSSSQGNNSSFDLGSSDRVMSANNQTFTSATIVVGGTSQTITNSSLLTPAEFVALNQVLTTGQQSIVLNSNGTAGGGSFNLSSVSGLSNLVIPQGVTGIFDAGGSIGSALNISGNLTNSGNLYAISSNSQVTTGIINAANIFNNQGAILSSVLPTSGIAGYSNLLSSLNLNINALNNIMNAGLISSSGSLTATAGGQIINALPTGVIGNLPMMQAMNNLNLQAANVINQGILASQMSNINIATTNLTNSGLIQALTGNITATSASHLLEVNSTLGSMIARDNINFSTQSILSEITDPLAAKAYLTLLGGSLDANEIHFDSPSGLVAISADRLDGPVHISAGLANVGVAGGDLHIASLNLTGDPIFYNSGGNLDLTLTNTTYQSFGGDFIALATGNITASGVTSGTTIDAKDTSGGNGGDIHIAAGVTFTVNGGSSSPISCTDCSSNYSITGISSTGGNVSLGLVNLRTNSANITVEAHSGSTNSGTIAIGNIDVSGNGGAANSAGLGNNGSSAGTITVNADNNVTTGALRAFGGGGGGAYAGAGGNAGNGGNITAHSEIGTITVNGEINSSGGGGGGGVAGDGGSGGSAGIIDINAYGALTINGAILAAGGGGGGAYDGGGGGSFGGGGGGGSYGTGAGGGGGFYGGGGGANGGYYGGGGAGGFSGGGAGGNSGGTSGTSGSGGGGGGGGAGGGFGLGGAGSNGGGAGGNIATNGTSASGYVGGTAGSGNQIKLSGLSITIPNRVSDMFTSATYGSYSIYAGTGGSVLIANPPGVSVQNNVYSADMNLQSGTATVTANVVSNSVTAFIVGSAGTNRARGSINGSGGITINGSSAGTNVTSGSYNPPANLTITVNGSSVNITNGMSITPAQWIAAIQKSNTGIQSLTLNASANASGGSFNITASNVPGSGFTNLTLPSGVTANSSVSSLDFSGSATINGTLNMSAGSGSIQLTATSVTLGTNSTVTFNAPGHSGFIIAPTITLGSGSTISSNNTWTSIVLASSGNISISSGSASINATNTAGTGGLITIAAGVNSSVSGDNLNISGTSTSGGNISLSNVDLITNGRTASLQANAGSTNSGTLSIATIETSGAGAAPDTNTNTPGQNAGSIIIYADSTINTEYLRAYGGGGGGAGGAGGTSAGGDGGNGGNISVTSASSTVTIAGDVNSSGGGGGGGYGGAGGNGGTAGDINIYSSSTLSITGPILGAGGGGGGGGSSSGGGGGGGSFGGGGGGATGYGATRGGGGGGGFYGGGGGGRPGFYGGGGGGGIFGGGAGGNSNGVAGSAGTGGRGANNGGTGGNFGSGGGAGTNGAAGGAIGASGSASGGNSGGTGGSGGSITLRGSTVVVPNRVTNLYGTGSYTAYSIYAGTGGSVTITNPPGVQVANSVYSTDLNLLNSSATVTANLISTSVTAFRVGQTTGTNRTRGSINASGGITINAANAGTNVTTGTFNPSSTLTIVSNGSNLNVTNGMSLTPAQWIAAIQVSNTGTQTLTLNGAGGNASAGSFSIDAINVPGSNFTTLNLPSAVTLNSTVNNLTFSSSVTVSGTLNMTVAGSSAQLNTPSLTLSGSINFSAVNHTGFIISPSITFNNGSSITNSNTNTNIAIASTNNITLASGTSSITATNTTGTGGIITLAAGVNASASGSNLLISGTSSGGGNLALSGMTLMTNSNDISIQANSGSTNSGTIAIGILNSSGAGGAAPGIGVGLVGGSAGNISVAASSTISTGALRAFGGGGGGGNLYNGGGGVGGNGGNGGNITVTSSNAAITIGAEVNVSGGGGGGGSSGGGGTGGNGGVITISSPLAVSISGAVLAAAGGGGGAGANAGGGGGSFGGGGGGAGNNAGGGGGGGGGGFLGGGGGASTGSAIGGAGGGIFGAGSGGASNGSTGGSGSGGNGGGGNAGGAYGNGGVVSGANGGNAGANGNGAFAGSAGTNGSITLSGSTVTVSSTVNSLFTGGSFSAYSVVSGNTSININQGTTSITTYNANMNLASTTASVTASLTGAQFATATGSGTNRAAGGLRSLTGSISLNGTTAGSADITSGNVSGAGRITIVENNANKVVTNGNSVTPAEWVAMVQATTGTQTITLNSSGAATTGSYTIGASNVPVGNFTTLDIPVGIVATATVTSLTYSGAATISGNLNFQGNGTLTVNSLSNSGTITSSSGSATITVNATNAISGNGSITAQTVNLSSTAGSIGVSSGNRLQVVATNLTANASGSGQNVYINNTGASTSLGNSQANNGTFDLISSGALSTVNGSTISADSVNLLTSSGNIGINGTVSASTDLNVQSAGNVTLTAGTLQANGGGGGNINVTTAGGTPTITLNSTSTIQGDNIVLTAASLVDNGNINSQYGSGTITIQSTTNLTISGTPASAIAVAGTTTDAYVYFLVNGASSINLNSSLTADAGALGLVAVSAADSGGSISFASSRTLTVTSSQYVGIWAPQITFNASSGVNASGSGQSVELSSSGINGTITLASGSTINVTAANGGVVYIGPYNNSSLQFLASGGSATTLQVNADFTQTYSNGSSTTIGTNVTLSTTGSMWMQIDGGTLTNNGTIQSTGNNANITISSASGTLTLAGSSGQFVLSGSGSNIVSFSSPGTMNFTTNYTVNAGSAGGISLNGGTVNLGNNVTLLAAGQGGIETNVNQINFGTSATLSATRTTGSAIGTFTQQIPLVIQATNGSQAYITTSGGTINLNYTSIQFSKTAGASTATINFTGPTNINTTGNITIDANVIVNTDNSIAIANYATSSNFIYNGSLTSTANGGTISISGQQLAFSGTPQAAISVTGTGPNVINVNSNGSLTFSDSFSFNPGINGTVNLRAVYGDLNIAASKTVSATNGALITIQANSITLGNGANISTNASTGNGIMIGTPYNVGLTFNLPGSGGSATLSTSGANIVVNSYGALSFITSSGNSTLNLNAGQINITSYNGTTLIGAGVNVSSSSDINFNVSQATIGNQGEINTISAGSIALIASTGILSIGANAQIYANEGNIILQNGDTANGSISIGGNSIVYAYTNSNPALGNVTIVLGDIPVTPVSGTPPANVTVNQSGGGQVYFGANGITANGPTNTLNAIARSIVFDTGGAPATSIVLQGGVAVTADPPLPAQTASIPVDNKVENTNLITTFADGANVISDIKSALIPLDTLPMTTLNISDYRDLGNKTIATLPKEEHLQKSLNNFIPDHKLPTNEPSNTAPSNSQEAIDKSGKWNPINFVRAIPTTELNTEQIPEEKSSSTGSKIDIGNSTIHTGIDTHISYNKDKDVIIHHTGEALFSAKEDTAISLGKGSLIVEKGAVVLIEVKPNLTRICNIYETAHKSAIYEFNGKKMSIAAGEELMVSSDKEVLKAEFVEGHTGRRDIVLSKFGKQKHFSHCELSLVGLMQDSNVVKRILSSSNNDDLHLKGKVLKMAACLMVVTGKHGIYSANPTSYKSEK